MEVGNSIYSIYPIAGNHWTMYGYISLYGDVLMDA